MDETRKNILSEVTQIPVIPPPSHLSNLPTYHTCSPGPLFTISSRYPPTWSIPFTFLVFAVIPYYILTSKDSEQETIKTACRICPCGLGLPYSGYFLPSPFASRFQFSLQLSYSVTGIRAAQFHYLFISWMAFKLFLFPSYFNRFLWRCMVFNYSSIMVEIQFLWIRCECECMGSSREIPTHK